MEKIPEISDNPSIDIALDTITKKKQALVFCSTRRSAEATAEKISGYIKTQDPALEVLSQEVLKVLSTPTKQCRRLALCVKKGIAFHHAGLAAKQRTLIEENFKSGLLKIICSTPTLAMGINLPAYRAIIQSLKRYGGRWGMQFIPTLEYHQMAGRAGRPDFNDKYGEAICIASNDNEAEVILEKFINADPEKIFSKLAVEPVLRTYCLSLLATGFADSKKSLVKFFENTFYGHQYGDMDRLEQIISKILGLLDEWEFIRLQNNEDFVSADALEDDRIRVTKLGERVAQLYLDPYTAHEIITSLRRAAQKITDEISFIHMACSTLELRPLSNVRMSEVEAIEAELADISASFIVLEPSLFDPDYEEFLRSVKTSLALRDWMDEKTEDDILEKYNITPGEMHAKKDLCDWILFAADEIAKMFSFNEQIKMIRKTRFRLDKGIKEELIPLARIRGIGRVRARKLFRNGIKDIGGIKKADFSYLSALIGEKTAMSLKKQAGEDMTKIKIKKGKRKGQTSVEKYF